MAMTKVIAIPKNGKIKMALTKTAAWQKTPIGT